MRLQSIDIENITSLRGKHSINFEDILKDDELFAITGPTGSGKSSILSAISLALYGKNYKKSLDSKDFVTLGQPSAAIKLFFNTKGENYCATWTLKVLKKNGEPIKKPSPQRILTKDGVAIEESADEIIGLTFDQFIRSVVLNQGQFSKFITSNFSERRKILERLYSENEISEINKKLRENVNLNKQEIELLEVKLDQSLPYTEEEIVDARNDLPGRLKKKTVLEDQVSSFTQLNQYLRDFTDSSFKRLDLLDKSQKNQYLLDISNDKRNDLLNQQKSISKDFENFKISYDKQMERYNLARVQQTKLNSINQGITDNKKKVSENVERSASVSGDIKTKKAEVDEISISLSALKSDNSLISLNKEQLLELEIIQNDISSTLQNNIIHSQNLKNSKVSLEQLASQGSNDAKELKELKDKLNDLSKSSTSDNFNDQTIQNLKNDEQKIENQLKAINDSLSKSKVYEEQTRSINLKIKAIKESTFQKDLSSLEDQLKTQTELLNNNKKIYSLQRNRMTLLELIEDSIDKGSCSLCNRPSKSEDFEQVRDECSHIDSDVSEEKITTLEEIVNNLTAKAHTLKSKISQSAIEDENLNSELEVLRKKIDSFTTDKEESKQLALKKESIKLTIEKLQTQQKKIELKEQRVKSLREEYQAKKKQYDELESIVNKNETLIQSKMSDTNELLKGNFSTNDNEKIKELINRAQQYLIKLKELETLSSFIKQLEKQIIEINNSTQKLNNQIDESSTLQQEFQDSIDEITNKSPLEELVTKLKEDFEQNSEKVKHITKLVSKEENEYTRLITMKESIFDQNKGHENTIMTTLGHLSSLLEKLVDHKSKNHETNIFISKTLQIKTYIEDLPTVEAYKRANLLLIAPEMDSLREELEETLQTISVYEEKIKLFDLKAKEQKKDKESLSTKKAIQARFVNLVEVLGKNKDEFRNFVLGFIEKQLILSTNSELNTICDGRYELIQKESSNGHEFFILDSWNGGLERKISTLSGGETFLVSLAMALSLAEMTRGQVDIDCFFIDEGFGSLDKDSIEDAYSALMSVRSRGKQIGIISHVKELTSRIGANINLNKSNDGQSKIEIIFN